MGVSKDAQEAADAATYIAVMSFYDQHGECLFCRQKVGSRLLYSQQTNHETLVTHIRREHADGQNV